MTYSSCWIRNLDSSVPGAFADRLGLKPGNDPYWIPDIVAWAKSASIPIIWKDNSWISVTASGGQLAQLFERVFGANRDSWPVPIDPKCHYEVGAEEF